MRRTSFAAIVLTGFTAGSGQVLVLRELLVLFCGNELSAGLVLASWLLWTSAGSVLGGPVSARLRRDSLAPALGLLLIALLLPLTVLWIRASRMVWAIPPGELVSPALMLAVSVTATGAFCGLSGLLFTACWKLHLAEGEGGRPILIYLGEALGTAAGGLFFYFVLLPDCSTLAAACLTSLVAAAIAALLPGPRRSLGRMRPAWIGAACSAVLLLAGIALNAARLDRLSHQWQWGPGLVAVRDTPYNNLALVRDGEQYSLFGSGLWFFSLPDPKTAEYAVHLALLQHPRPQRVLLIGGAPGLVAEILEHPGVAEVDVVEPDPAILKLLEAHLPAALTGPLHDRRVRLHHEDAGSFVRRSGGAYDAVLSSLGDPLNAALNRFYTVEFFQRVRRLLNPGGVFSFAVSAADILGPVQVRLLRSYYDTLGAVFPRVLVCLAESARFLASDEDGALTGDPLELAARITARGLDLQYVRADYLLDYLNPMRSGYLAALLGEGPARELNRDLAPACYLNGLLLWASQLHPGLERLLLAAARVRAWPFGLTLAALLTAYAAICWRGWLGRAVPCHASVLIMGGAQLGLEILLLLVFQILEGFVYQQLALIVTFFMAGAAVGAGLQSLLAARTGAAVRWLAAVQFAFAGCVLIVWRVFAVLHGAADGAAAVLPPAVLFPVLGGLAGVLGGLHFALALRVVSAQTATPAATAGRMYAVDLLGAALGSVLSSLYLLPVYGVRTTLFALCLVSLGAALALLRVRA